MSRHFDRLAEPLVHVLEERGERLVEAGLPGRLGGGGLAGAEGKQAGDQNDGAHDARHITPQSMKSVAGASRRARSPCTKVAARSPSTMR